MEQLSCNHRNQDLPCPISLKPCTGVCIYADILNNTHIALIVLDICNNTILCRNAAVDNIFKTIQKPIDYETVVNLLIPDFKEFISKSEHILRARVNLESMILGYSVYKATHDFIWIYLRDITEKARVESIAEAASMMDNLGAIISGVRHELGNPLNSIKVTLSVLKENIADYSMVKVLEFCDDALSEVRRIEYLLRSLKNFNMYESPEMQEMHIPSFMKVFLRLVSPTFENSGVSLRTSIDPGTDKAYTDPRALQQVLVNLTNNSLDAVQGIRDPQVDIEIISADGWVTLSVRDNGRGLSELEKQRLYVPFTTTKPGGTGLGMTIVKKLLTGMSGSIDVESEEGVGTTVSIKIPEGDWVLKAE